MSLEGHLSYQSVSFIIIMVGVFIITSGLFSLHGVAVDTLLVCWAGEWENRGQGNNVSAPKNMERLFGMSEEMVGVDNPISMDIIEGEWKMKEHSNIHNNATVNENTKENEF